MLFRLEAVEAEGIRKLGEIELQDLGELEGTLILALPHQLSVREWREFEDAWMQAFPGKKTMVLPNDVRLIRAVPVDGADDLGVIENDH